MEKNLGKGKIDKCHRCQTSMPGKDKKKNRRGSSNMVKLLLLVAGKGGKSGGPAH